MKRRAEVKDTARREQERPAKMARRDGEDAEDVGPPSESTPPQQEWNLLSALPDLPMACLLQFLGPPANLGRRVPTVPPVAMQAALGLRWSYDGDDDDENADVDVDDEDDGGERAQDEWACWYEHLPPSA